MERGAEADKLQDRADKTRVSVTMTELYVNALDRLVEKGLYLGRGDIILEALRLLFRSYGIEPFKLVEEAVEGPE